MKIINHILLCLDLSEIDEDIVHYSAVIAKSFSVEKITLTHIIQPSDLPKKDEDSLNEVKNSIDEMISIEFENFLKKELGENMIINIYTQIAEDEGLEIIVSNVEDMNVDMLVIGQKYGEYRQKFHSRKPFAESDCDVLFVPENPPLQISRVLCAIDYSEVSKAAFAKAFYLHKNKNSDLICYYLQDISRTYFPATTSTSENYIQLKAKTEHRDFLSQFSLNPEDYPLKIGTGEQLTSEAEKLYKTADENKADLIIIGASGKTSNETSLLGNIAETLRRMDTYIPIMITKDSGNKDLLTQLFS
ncbi:hypothetical protein Flexsi_0554 [Flexistipes sinusarabici DSM 4947]|uniref:UspA domain-containing protein n=1 Tax=Flexistipes sinusarabici (strain ATCC 49648 / DSM 4947 / MAS 10) TaxID=717231 RepID=F8E9Q2_FLESM|nr:universal stress protein [Flexistipes sinusarabici]AEI14235.1 hypothetical protein Flexsi_0554 [Flexistipes sinusarabici DSM 4947]